MDEKLRSQEPIDQRVPPSDEIHNKPSEYVPIENIPNQEIQDIIDRLFRVVYGRQGDAQHPTLVGLAAPQIGILKRIVIIASDSTGDGKQSGPRAFVNPVIVAQSKEKVEGREGCFSTGNICGIVERSKKVTK